MKPEIFNFDIEISPNSGYFWKSKYLGEVSIIEVLEESQLLCFGFQWNGGKYEILSQKDAPEYKVGVLNDKWLIQQLRDMLDKADIVIGQNIERFDIKFFNSRCIVHKIEPPSRFKTYDTLKINKKYFSHLENNLKALSKKYGITNKLEHSGFMTMFYKALAGDWAEMERYCKGDVKSTWELFKEVLPWENRANIGWHNKKQCPHCSSFNTHSRGTRAISGGFVRRYQCQDEFCGRFFDGEKVIRRL